MQKIRTSATIKERTVPLIIEPQPVVYNGFLFVTLVQYRKNPILVIVDNIDEENLRAFVLDLCGPEGIDEELLLNITTEWFNTNRFHYPISVEFSKRGLTKELSRIYRILNIEFVSRVIGPVHKYPMSIITSIKRRRRKPIPPGVEIFES